MLGEGMVSFGVADPTASRRKARSSPKIVRSSVIGPSTRIEGGANSRRPVSLTNSTRSEASSTRVTPPSA